MNLAYPIAFALVLATTPWPGFAADYFWNCTKPDGTKYADATQCDKGDTAIKVLKNPQTAAAQTAPVQAAQSDAKSDNKRLDTGVCPTTATYCLQADFGVSETSPRAQAISEFMRKKQCEFLKKFPERCTAPR